MSDEKKQEARCTGPFSDARDCPIHAPQGKAQPDSGEMEQEVDRWPLCCQESYDFGFQMGKREMADKAAQESVVAEWLAHVPAEDFKPDALKVLMAFEKFLQNRFRSLASAAPPQGEAEKEGRG